MRETLEAIADRLIPADEHGPSATQVGAVRFDTGQAVAFQHRRQAAAHRLDLGKLRHR